MSELKHEDMQLELEAIRHAAHMPDNYEYGLPSWINYVRTQWQNMLAPDGGPIRRSEDIEHIATLTQKLEEAESVIDAVRKKRMRDGMPSSGGGEKKRKMLGDGLGPLLVALKKKDDILRDDRVATTAQILALHRAAHMPNHYPGGLVAWVEHLHEVYEQSGDEWKIEDHWVEAEYPYVRHIETESHPNDPTQREEAREAGNAIGT